MRATIVLDVEYPERIKDFPDLANCFLGAILKSEVRRTRSFEFEFADDDTPPYSTEIVMCRVTVRKEER